MSEDSVAAAARFTGVVQNELAKSPLAAALAGLGGVSGGIEGNGLNASPNAAQGLQQNQSKGQAL